MKQPYDWRVDIVTTDDRGQQKTSTYLAGFAEWQAGAVVLSRAVTAIGNPNSPTDRIIVPLGAQQVAFLNFIGPNGGPR